MTVKAEDPATLVAVLANAYAARELELFLVGGALRDSILGKRPHELDFATNASPSQTVEILGAVPEVSVYRVGEKFGTIGGVWRGLRVEITTYRSAELYEESSRKPEVTFGNSIREDLSRRDFTINAMALSLASRPASGLEVGSDVQAVSSQRNFSWSDLARTAATEMIDPYDGKADLKRGLVRAVGDPQSRFREDPLRLMRGVRFAAALDFSLEPLTWAGLKETAPALARVSRERVAEEFTRMLTGPRPRVALGLLRDGGLLEASIPSLVELTRMPDHGPRHPLSLWDHTMNVVEGVQPDRVTRWAALLHDIGKPKTRSFDSDGRIRFFNHEELGVEMAREILSDLRVSNDTISSVSCLIETHMQLHQYSDEWSDGAVRRLRDRLGPDFERALDLADADARGHGETSWGASKIADLARRSEELREKLPEVKSPLTGDQLVARYGREPGPWIRTVKDALLDLVLEGQLDPDDNEGAWREADRVMSGVGGSG